MSDVAPLRSRVSGPVLISSDDGYVVESAAWIQNFVHTPDVVVGATSASDVVEAVKFAAANGLAVRVQGSGHGSDAAITDGVLITTRRLDSVSIDPATRVATVGAGVLADAAIAAAAEHGLAPISGSSGTVGLAGLLLGGGLGPLARSHGFGSDWVRGFEVVTGNGELVRANAEEHPDLFWALRGGKGGLGIVTELKVELVELPTLYGGSLTFDAENIEAALRVWVTYVETADAKVSTSAVILRFPDLPFIPEPVRGRTLLAIRFAYTGDAASGEKLAAPLRAAAPVYIDELGEMAAARIASIHNDPTNPTMASVRGRMLTGIDQDFATTLLGFAGPGRQFPFVGTEIRHLGSATLEDVPGGSAVGGRQSRGTLTLAGAPNPQLFDTVIPEAAAACFEALAPWISAENNVNFAGAFASREEYEAAWPVATFARLTEVRKKYDPKGLFSYGVS
ncbi:MAG TPA: FAD-binding oxidoreductase [Galbitalea sp.]|jgi:FAD/FMN-containing dehydrogenase|nr:FAD-binding oxidoreductase [Galbitalea sp.]